MPLKSVILGGLFFGSSFASVFAPVISTMYNLSTVNSWGDVLQGLRHVREQALHFLRTRENPVEPWAEARRVDPAKLPLGTFVLDEGSGVRLHPEYQAFPYSDGQAVEERLLQVLTEAADLSTMSRELVTKITDWPSEYHLSPKRHNLLRHFDRLDAASRILVVVSTVFQASCLRRPPAGCSTRPRPTPFIASLRYTCDFTASWYRWSGPHAMSIPR